MVLIVYVLPITLVLSYALQRVIWIQVQISVSHHEVTWIFHIYNDELIAIIHFSFFRVLALSIHV